MALMMCCHSIRPRNSADGEVPQLGRRFSPVSAQGEAVSPRRADDLTGPKLWAIFRSPRRVELLGGGAPEMAAQIANEIRLNAPLHKAPLPVTALETVVVPTADDRLQR